MSKKIQEWNVGDLFAICLSNGMEALGQVIGIELDMPRSATVALFDRSVETGEAAVERFDMSVIDVYSVLFVTVQNLDSGKWRCICNMPVQTELQPNDYYLHKSNGFVGAKVIGCSIVDAFADSYFGLSAWDDWYNPNYLDSLMRHGYPKPIDRIRYKE